MCVKYYSATKSFGEVRAFKGYQFCCKNCLGSFEVLVLVHSNCHYQNSIVHTLPFIWICL